jgi:hypothetical protein
LIVGLLGVVPAAAVAGEAHHTHVQPSGGKGGGGKEEKATVTVTKEWVVRVGDTSTTYAQGAQPSFLQAQLTVTSPVDGTPQDVGWGVTVSGFKAGDTPTIDERVAITKSSCHQGSATVTKANGAAVSEPLPFKPTLAAGYNKYEITNVVTCTKPTTGPAQPSVRTHTSKARVRPGKPFSDRVTVAGLVGGGGVAATARLYGPFGSRAATACTPGHLARSLTMHVDNGVNRTPPVRLHQPGIYTWQVTTQTDALNRSASHPCGQAKEVTVVAKPTFTPPMINGGFSGTLRPHERARRAPITVESPSIGLDATVLPERVVHGEMLLPGDVGQVGWLHKSAGVGDAIGTAVIGGHVSDRHDSPGAMFHLSHARAGEQVTVDQGGQRYRFKVVKLATFHRDHRLPRRFFTTTGPHRLVLISCTDRIVFPNGHFHYTKYVVVVARQIHPRP